MGNYTYSNPMYDRRPNAALFPPSQSPVSRSPGPGGLRTFSAGPSNRQQAPSFNSGSTTSFAAPFSFGSLRPTPSTPRSVAETYGRIPVEQPPNRHSTWQTTSSQYGNSGTDSLRTQQQLRSSARDYYEFSAASRGPSSSGSVRQSTTHYTSQGPTHEDRQQQRYGPYDHSISVSTTDGPNLVGYTSSTHNGTTTQSKPPGSRPPPRLEPTTYRRASTREDEDDDESSFAYVDPADYAKPSAKQHPVVTQAELRRELLAEANASPRSKAAAPALRDYGLLVEQPTPFRNLGNTCYMNATLQCVLHSGEFFNRLVQYSDSQGGIDGYNRSSGNGSGAAQKRLLCDSIRLVHRDSTASAGVNLTSIKSETTKINSEFAGCGQNDAHEFLRAYLYGLHGEVNRAGRARYREMLDKPGESDSEAELRWAQYLLEHDDSLVYDHFGGVLRCTSICAVCHNRSLSFDPFLDLSLACPAQADADAPGYSMTQLINNFLALERLSGSNQLVCPRCRRLEDADRSFYVAQWPDHLVFHLKRFNSKGVKSSAPVSLAETFTIEGRTRSGFRASNGRSATMPPGRIRYQLAAVVCHEGSSFGGHYIAYVRKGSETSGEWFCCNDSNISRVDRRHVLFSVMRSAYLLLYDIMS